MIEPPTPAKPLQQPQEPSPSIDKDGWDFIWPLTYKRPRSIGNWFNLYQFRSPTGKAPELTYCTTLKRSEEVAQRFLKEPILGFDMEWQGDAKKRKTIKDEISVIQLASETHVAVFHIAAHQGSTVDEIVAPSLKKILESPTIAKVGVAVMNADFSRLRKHFRLKPQAAFELSRLYRLVKFGGKHLCTTDSKAREAGLRLLTTKLVAFDTQMKGILNLGLWKGEVRTSHWNDPRHLSSEQIKYAANDAYAGFVLYHCMDAKRKKMDPVPQLPLLVDDGEGEGFPAAKGLRLRPEKDGGESVSIEEFWPEPIPPKVETAAQAPVAPKVIDLTQDSSPPQPQSRPEAANSSPKKQKRPRDSKEKKDEPQRTLTAVERQLYGELASCRYKQQSTHGFGGAFMVAPNTVLQDLAFYQPTRLEDLGQLKGIGPKKIEQFGSAWVDVIIKFRSARGITTIVKLPYKKPHRSSSANNNQSSSSIPAQVGSSPLPDVDTVLQSQKTKDDSPGAKSDSSGSSSPAFEDPIPRAVPQQRFRPSAVENMVEELMTSSFDGLGRQNAATDKTPNSSQPPQLHTGLSFVFEETRIEDIESYSELFMDTIDSTPESPSSSALQRQKSRSKRRRTEAELLAG